MKTNPIESKNSIKSVKIDTQVLIVGAGLTGLTLACDLLRRGVPFRIIDKSPVYFPGSRGKGLTPRSLEVFDDLGLIDQLMPYGYSHPIAREYDGPTLLKEDDLHEGLTTTPNIPYLPLWIPQFQIEAILRQQLAKGGKSVELATELTNIEQNDGWVTATVLKDQESRPITCLYLVAADGGRSFVRKFLHVGFEGETREAIRILVGDVHTDALDHEHTHMWKHHPDGFLALTPFAQSDIFQMTAQVAPDFEATPTLELFQQILQKRTGMAIELYAPTWLSSFKVNIRMVDRTIIGRVLLGGDAAHVHSPTGGQGMNTGLQDAYNLGWKLDLVLRGANPSLLESYQEERLPVAAAVLQLSTKLLDKFQGLQRALPGDTERFQLSLNYRHSRLSQQATSLPIPVQAGDRAPDAPLQDGKGNPIRLYDLFRGPHWTLLVNGDIVTDELTRLPDRYSDIKLVRIVQSASCQPAEGFVDAEGYFSLAYGKQPGLMYLVRPDGYLGFIGEATQSQALLAYVDRLLVR
ncbi:FAD-dependent monooxygenase [Spirosoma humi]